MDVRSIEAKAPVVEHNGTVPVWWMIESREFKDITDGAFRAEMQANCAELLARARALAESATAYGDAALEKLHAGGKP